MRTLRAQCSRERNSRCQGSGVRKLGTAEQSKKAPVAVLAVHGRAQRGELSQAAGVRAGGGEGLGKKRGIAGGETGLN